MRGIKVGGIERKALECGGEAVGAGIRWWIAIDHCAHNRSRSANAVVAAFGQGEHNRFIGLDCGISRRIHHNDGAGGSSGKAHRLGGGAGRYAGVISSKRGGTAHGVVHRQSGCGRPGSCEGINKIGRAIFCD